jgi:hypothetical protein
MSIPELDEQKSDDKLMDARLKFTEQTFNNVQAMNRQLDFKANFLIGAVGVLTAALGILAGSALSGPVDFTWPYILRVVGLALMLIYLLTAFSVIHPSILVYKAMANTLRPNTAAPGMSYPLLLLKRIERDGKPDEDVYLNKLLDITPVDLLHDYANQVVEVSNIYKYKQTQINAGVWRFQWLSALWVITAMVLVAVIVIVPKV